jgi:HEXXH motif-containing protein
VHQLSTTDLRAVAAGEIDATVIGRLKVAELSKHKLLLTALMRAAAKSVPAVYAGTLVPAYRLLADVQAGNKQVVRDMLASPQFGSWTAHCLSRLGDFPGELESAFPLEEDLGQLSIVACAAALLARYPFVLDIPLRHGTVTFPMLGTARPGASAEWEWGSACLDDRGGRVCSSVSATRIALDGSAAPEPDDSWSQIPRLTAISCGLAVKFWLDDLDPYLDRYGLPRAAVGRDDLLTWQSRLTGAWRILARQHRPLAAMIAELIGSLVPLAEPFPGQPVSATAAAAFGAIGLSLPCDALAMAEVLVHECHHAVLSAVTDLVPLTRPGGEQLTYAPWREDARPVGALPQGIYAHFGLAGFWRRQRREGSAQARFRGNVEFTRGLNLTDQTATALGDSGVLTEAGTEFIAALRGRLATWHGESLPASVRKLAGDCELDHRVRWRLRHVRPDPRDMRSLVRSWLAGAEPALPLTAVSVSVERRPLLATGTARSYLLMLRYRDPERFQRWIRHGGSPSGAKHDHRRVDPADRAFLSGNYAAAAEGYLRRIAAGDDAESWAGFAVVRQHTGPAGVAAVLAHRPEVTADLHERLRPHGRPTPDRLAAWLADPSGPPSREPRAW